MEAACSTSIRVNGIKRGTCTCTRWNDIVHRIVLCHGAAQEKDKMSQLLRGPVDYPVKLVPIGSFLSVSPSPQMAWNLQ
jgi:hypothetical protein